MPEVRMPAALCPRTSKACEGEWRRPQCSNRQLQDEGIQTTCLPTSPTSTVDKDAEPQANPSMNDSSASLYVITPLGTCECEHSIAE
eukprot:2480080-Pyramimonas_sp.AAC.1